MLSPAHSRTAKGLSIALIAVFAIASLTSIAQFASAQSDGLPHVYTVSWQKETPYDSSNWTWADIQWVYGPSITIDIAYTNGTSLLGPMGGFPSHYLSLGQQFYINITIPKSLLELGRNVSSISFSMSKSETYFNLTQSIPLWYANIYLTYLAYPMQGCSGPEYKPIDPWTFYSTFCNCTVSASNGSSGGGPSGPLSPPPTPPALFIPNRAACRFIETCEKYVVWFQGELNASMPALGTFWYNFNTMDTKGSPIRTTATGCGNIVVGRPDPNSGPGCGGDSGYYYYYTTGADGKETRIVNPGTQFDLVAEFSGITNAKNMTLFLNPPVDYNWWYDTARNSRGIMNWQDILVSEWWFNYTSSEWQYVTWMRSESRTVRISCDILSGTFSIDEGFRYGTYIGPSWDNYTEFFDVDMAGSSNFFTINLGASDGSLSDNKIDFALTIPQSANASAGTYYFNINAYKNDGKILYGSGSTEYMILGDNVVIPGLLKTFGDNPLLRITPDKYFRAAMQIMGTEGFRKAVSGETSNVTFVFSSPWSYNWWSVGDVDYSSNSYLKFMITRNTIANRTYVEVFNCTSISTFNRITQESSYSYLDEKLNDADYVRLAPVDFVMTYESSTNVLTLAFNMTFIEGVPEGYYGWLSYLCNKTDTWYDYYETTGNPMLKYTTIEPDCPSVLVGTVDSYWYAWNTKQAWSVDAGTGALDLDGNNVTKNDQYYVKRIYTSTSYWAQSGERMFVFLSWGSYSMHSYFALMNYSWRNEWSEYYVWIYPGNRSTVPNDRFVSQINGTIWDQYDGTIRPEYVQLSCLTSNRTWDKIKTEYSQYSWWKEEQKWTWLEINFDENFFAANPGGSGGSSNNLFFQYAGLLVFNDTNDDGVLDMGFTAGEAEAQELTHYFIFEDASGIILTTPFPGDVGSVQVNVDDGISWGVSVLGLNGTTYPTQVSGYSGFAGLGWWWHDCYGTYTPQGDFSTIPSSVGIDSLNFTAHFVIPHPNFAAGATNEVRVKIDEGVGSWTLNNQPSSRLLNYSLALAFFASSSNSQYSFTTTNGDYVPVDGGSKASNYYNVTQDGVKLANIQMGGATYYWGKDGSTHTVRSSTTPMSAFTAMYSAYSMTGSGSRSTCSFSVMGQNYYMTSTFKQWDGFSVYSDPYFAIFQSNPGEEGPGGQGGSGISPLLLISAAAIAIVSLSVFIVARKRKIPAISEPKAEQNQEVP
jgi:hypothetical protein